MENDKKLLILNSRIPLQDNSGNTIGSLTIKIDKEPEDTEEAFHENEETFGNIFNSAKLEFIRLKISDDKLFEYNKQLTKKFEYESRDELMTDYFASNGDAFHMTGKNITNKLIKNILPYDDKYIKRFFNIIASLILLILLFPVSFLFALLQQVESKGPVFFKQKRVGYRGKEFNLIKFRTMINNAEKHGSCFAKKNDSRVTRIGKIMRKYHFDEVPQLINILKGELNLIGPRPERKEFIKILKREIPLYKKRLEVRPGLTGWAQVNFRYAGTRIKDHLKKLEYDLFYMKNQSILLDALIMLKTVKAVLGRNGT